MNGETYRYERQLMRSRSPLTVAGWLAFVASGIAAVAVVRAMRCRRDAITRECAIDDRIAESFPASDPPWQP